jgi:hypothetical protein
MTMLKVLTIVVAQSDNVLIFDKDMACRHREVLQIVIMSCVASDAGRNRGKRFFVLLCPPESAAKATAKSNEAGTLHVDAMWYNN